MSDDPDHRARPRANTTSFSAFGWRKPPPQPSTLIATTSPKPISIHELIEDLTPPAVPSLAYARSLAALLQTTSPCPTLPKLIPILGTFCTEHSPSSLQAAGYDILAAYCSNPETTLTSSSDVLACFELFDAPWTLDLWEPRFKAFANFRNAILYRDIFLSNVCTTLIGWIKSAFDPMLVSGSLPLLETFERQRSLKEYFSFLFTILTSPEFLCGAHEEEAGQVLSLLGASVRTAILLPREVALISSPENNSPRVHRRNQSSASTPVIDLTAVRRPTDVAVEAYVEFLSAQHRKLSHLNLSSILPLLFRSLGFYASQLPPLSLHQVTEHPSNIEGKICGLIDSLFTGPHASSCTLILQHSLFPDAEKTQDPLPSVQLSFGAYRVLRNLLRRSLLARLARAYISKANPHTYGYTGAAGSVDLPQDFISLAWPKEDVSVWEFSRVSPAFCKSLGGWMVWQPEDHSVDPILSPDVVLLEAAGLLIDVLYALDYTADEDDFDEEEVLALSKALHQLVPYVRVYRTPEGAPYIFSRSLRLGTQPTMLQTISFILSRDISLPVNWFMPNILLSVADHLSDDDSSRAIAAITKHHGFSPTSPEWMETWDDILRNPNIFSGSKPLTWATILGAVETVRSIIKDVPSYRKPWVESVLRFWKAKSRSDLGDGAEVLWLVLGEEVVLRQAESGGEVTPDPVMDDILLFLAEMAVNDQAHVGVNSRSPSSDSSISVSSVIPPPTVRQDARASRKGGEHTLPSVMSILTTFTTGSSSRSQSQNRRPTEEDISEPTQDPETPLTQMAPSNTFTRSVGATLALILAFGQLSFTPRPAKGFDFYLLVRIFRVLLQAACSSTCQKARLTCLRFLMRLRADRDHKVYFAASGYDPDGHVLSMARVLNRARSEEERADSQGAERGERGRPAEPLSQRHRGRALAAVRHDSLSKHSRSASRAPETAILQPLWQIPDILPFKVPFSDMPTKGISSYAHTPSEEGGLLPVSEYLNIVINLLSEEQDWEILSFVLCHLPVQLSHKHLFCGPKCRVLMGQLLKTLCTGISTKEFGIKIHPWPEGLKPRDAYGLAYHSLSVLISYKRCFDGQSLHHLIEVFLDGLSGSPSAIKCCLHALSLSAFELKPSMTRYLSRILEKLSQIMSNPTMSVHIIDFLSIIGSIQSLHVNFREQEYKMVFGVALQYLQQYNRQDSANQISWALSQHVRIMSYYIIYVWFLSLRLSDRPRHIPFICRQLLLANEGHAAVDQSTEVCFDWLARYSYASADPRPANSTFSDIITDPPATVETAISEKTWVVGNSIVTIRTLSRLGWLEVVSRRASGLTKFLCRAENVPLVGPGDLDPDMLSIPASFMMERTQRSSDLIPKGSLTPEPDQAKILPPDPITGYVWSGTAPSQRRKGVAIDPSYFPLQLSSFPDKNSLPFGVLVTDSAKIKSFIRTLDRVPVIDTHKVGIMYVAPGQTTEEEILQNTYGSPAYTRFLEGIGRLIDLRGQMDVYAGGLDPDEDGEYAYAWWDDNSQVLYHTATLMPTDPHDKYSSKKKRHIGNDLVRIVWNDSGLPYRFDTLATQFQFVNVVIEPHSKGVIAAFSDNVHENEYFKVTVQRVPGMPEFSPVGEFKLISAQELPLLVRQLSLLSDWFAFVFQTTERDTQHVEVITNWRSRLDTIQRFKSGLGLTESHLGTANGEDVLEQQHVWDFSSTY